ncbi:hypothetical protein CK203_112077 [Vitis vinifera]|uniref:Uncharacterized protein n=1 Tax=Vitis vinifera TaxID=29760 RepID=A0A438CEW4_VITVI|nr:hypothetical protein CK203_112077 [Vitis vinifera]
MAQITFLMSFANSVPSHKILFELIAKGGTVKGLIEEKDLVQASNISKGVANGSAGSPIIDGSRTASLHYMQ